MAPRPANALVPAVLGLAALLALACAGCGPKGGGCPSGQVQCGGCYDPAGYQTDPVNCGACGVACGAGATCAGGLCQCGGGTTRCDELVPRCRNLQADDGACGSCAMSCTATKPGSTCQAGTCACGGASPDDCGAICTNVQTDPKNCFGEGGCGHPCPLTREACSAGVCGCPASFPTECPVSSPTACVNTTNDPSNCGACGTICLLAGEICSGSTCKCPASLPDPCPAVSPTACVNFDTDPQHCGSCSTSCPAGATCTGGACACPAGQIVCGNACIACAGGTCNAGACKCPSGPTSGCGGQCCEGGTGCCTNGACQTKHSNGVGGSFFDCNPLYAPAQTTQQAALEAADSWAAGGTTFTQFCDGFCVARQAGSQCAVWCYGGSVFPGRVNLNTMSIACICPTSLSGTWQ